MALTANDIRVYLTGGVANTDPNLSLGGDTSTTEAGTGIHALFDKVTSSESTAGDIEYRAISIKNTHVSETAYAAVIYISIETTSVNTTVAVGYDSVGTQAVANESTAPAGVSFSTPTTKATGISVGDITAGSQRRIWERRTVTAGAASLATDAGQITISFDTV